jgi:hypothetical protein
VPVATRQAEALVTERASSRGEVRQYWSSGSVLAESKQVEGAEVTCVRLE